jgi:ATP-dependent Clp protease ATP-binding subunit ClpA
MPFSAEEQAVIAHKFLLQLANNVRRPISISKQLIGNVILHVRRDTAVCTALANDCYDADMGARSLESGVKIKIETLLVREYLAVNETISEWQPVEEYFLDIDQGGHIVLSRKS